MAETTAKPRKKKRIKELEVMVAEVIRETHDTTTLILFTGNDKLEYKAGHFITISPHQFEALARWTHYLEDLKGKREPPRAYSLASSPTEKWLSITIKEEEYVSGKTKYPPLLSPVLVRRTPPGTRMVVTGFAGPYILPDDIESRTDHLVHICAGSGVVPNYSIIKYCLDTGLNLKHTLIYGSKTWGDIIYREPLEQIAAEHADKVKVVHAISREPDAVKRGSNVYASRVTEALIRAHIDDPSAIEVFSCGPANTKFDKQAAKKRGEPLRPRFMESVLQALDNIGVPKNKVHKESYG